MALKIIGAGLGRTGTLSLKLALEQLGFGPCYHMAEWVEHPEHGHHWQAAAAGADPGWETLFADYRSAVDIPASLYWKALYDHNPGSKVILTVRPSADWHASLMRTIYPASRGLLALLEGGADHPLRSSLERLRWVDRVVWQGLFGGRAPDVGHATAIFEAHNQTVRDTVPPDDLLEFPVGAGWGPLCRFLGCPVPDGPFPRSNSSSDFRQKMRDRMRLSTDA